MVGRDFGCADNNARRGSGGPLGISEPVKARSGDSHHVYMEARIVCDISKEYMNLFGN